MKAKSISVSDIPALMKEWHPELNGSMTPKELSSGSNKEVWWKCKHGHSWPAKVKDRTRKRYPKSCPTCNSLWFLNQELCAEFDYQKNSGIDPKFISKNSSQKIHWLCSTCGASYLASVNNRNANKSGCPTCSGRVVSDQNRLSFHSPHLVKEWSPKNKQAPTGISYGSDTKVWWICSECDYEWKASINKRSIYKRGCPRCNGKVATDKNRLALINPELLAELHPTKNKNIDLSEITFGSNKKLWWQCQFGHEWKAQVNNRARGAGCPECVPHTSKAELRIYTELEALFDKVENRSKIDGIEVDIFLPKHQLGVEYDGIYWHQSREKNDEEKNQKLNNLGISLIRVREKPLNKIQEKDIVIEPKALSLTDVKLLVSHIEELIIDPSEKITLREYQTITDFLGNERYLELVSLLPSPDPSKSLKNLAPEVCKKWDYEKNSPLTPEMFHQFSMYVAHWVCSKNPKHEWTATIASQNKNGCPFCTGKSVIFEESFAARFPHAVAEFDQSKNDGLDPKDIAPKSGKKAWWTCSVCRHQWKTSFEVRARGSGCPKCGKKTAASKIGKKVICVQTNTVYSSVAEAASELNKQGYSVSRTRISEVCRGLRKSHKGLTFQFA